MPYAKIYTLGLRRYLAISSYMEQIADVPL